MTSCCRPLRRHWKNILPQIENRRGRRGSRQFATFGTRVGITHAVSFLGALTTDEVLDLMRQSDAFVLASRTETFGVVFIEALSQGLPVIATMCGGPQSIVTPENGILVPTENIPALTDALIEMYENRERFDHEKLRQDCLAEFSEEVIASSLIRTFEKIVVEKQKQP